MALAQPTTRTSSCLCGAVKLEISGNPTTFFVCHCDNCQKSSGSAFRSNVIFKIEDVRVKEGKEKIRNYEDKATKTGRTLVRSFCGQCGSTVHVKSTPDAIGVPVGTIDKTDDLAPQTQLFPKNKRPWVKGIETPKKTKL
ncbi:hypothetical protein AX15_002999 [Amanita polypyramis BW_CC]|nr:hypothetical protein AX15_002999 [Amanita polypyramis BW_CC]